MPKIGQGTFGCVYKPSLECKEPKPAAFYKNKVSKATDYENAKNEINEQAKIDKIDKSYTYHLPPPVLCSLKKEIIKDCKIQSKPDTLLILEDGGLNLSDFIKKVINSSNFTIKEKKKMIYDFCCGNDNEYNEGTLMSFLYEEIEKGDDDLYDEEDVENFFEVREFIENEGGEVKYVGKFNDKDLEYVFKVIEGDIECSWVEPK
jgi:hypothetical protein